MTKAVTIQFSTPNFSVACSYIDRIQGSILETNETAMYVGSKSSIEIRVHVDRSVELLSELIREGFLD